MNVDCSLQKPEAKGEKKRGVSALTLCLKCNDGGKGKGGKGEEKKGS